MTELGNIFTELAVDVIEKKGYGSNKMVLGRTTSLRYEGHYRNNDPRQGRVYDEDNPEIIDSFPERTKMLQKLVSMGYLREYKGDPKFKFNGKYKIYQVYEVPYYYGLTPKGWNVVDKYLIAKYGREEAQKIKGAPLKEGFDNIDNMCDILDSLYSGR